MSFFKFKTQKNFKIGRWLKPLTVLRDDRTLLAIVQLFLKYIIISENDMLKYITFLNHDI